MIVYSGSRLEFTQDVYGNVIEEKILARLKERAGHAVGASEVQSWQNSMQYMNNALVGAGIPDDAGVAVEYKIPLTSKRVDFILSGLDEAQQETVIIVELKQWTTVEPTAKDAIVEATAHRSFTASTTVNSSRPRTSPITSCPCCRGTRSSSWLTTRNSFSNAHSNSPTVPGSARSRS